MSDFRKIPGLLASICISLVLSACATARDPNGYAYPADFTDYSVNVGVPFHYEVSIGSITTWWKDGSIAGGKPIGSRMNGWVMGGTAGIMDGPIPDIVDFTYTALYEERRYHVRFEIPPHVKRVMYEKFFIRRPANGPLLPRYRRVISFGIMPGGRYVVWIESRRADAIEIARGQAEFIETTPYYEAFREGRHGHAIRLNGLHPEWTPEHWTAYDNILTGHFWEQNRYPDNRDYWMPPKLEELPPEAWKQGDMTPWRKRPPEVQVPPGIFRYE
ncbi:DUF2931 family protein [Hahella sp. SMD15-11]|uniref:DUF2931 family protein n=1 Tax=Thermohahella caldifontis TaxID=3142973 RepID=A0AB39US90_9GAMM